MRPLRSLAMAVASISPVLAVACSPGDDIVPVAPSDSLGINEYKLTPEAVQGDAAVARDAIVGPDTITLPFAGHENLASLLVPGSVFFADRAPNMAENNPYGFMVKVESLAQDGDQWVIRTLPAGMRDVFEDANFDFPLGNEPPPQTGLQSLDPLQAQRSGYQGEFPIGATFGRVFEGKLTSGNTQAKGELQLSGGFGLLLKPSGNFRYADRGYFSAPNLTVDLGLGIDLELGACAKVEGALKAGKMEHDGFVALDGKTRDVPNVQIPLPEITFPAPAPPPLVVTVRYQPTLFCGLNYTRSLGVAYQYKRSWQFDTSFGLREGSTFATGNMTDTGSQHRWEFVLKGGIAVTCGIDVKAGFYFYNSIGAYVKATPRAEVAVTGSARLSGGTNRPTEGQVQACASVDAVFETKWGLEASALGIDVGGEWGLLPPQRFPIPFPISACAQNFQPADGCEGKPNGLYCSGLDTRNSYRCQNNQTAAGGTACAQSQYCQPESGVMGTQAKTEGETAACGTTPPRPEQLDLQFCPQAPNFLRSE